MHDGHQREEQLYIYIYIYILHYVSYIFDITLYYGLGLLQGTRSFFGTAQPRFGSQLLLFQLWRLVRLRRRILGAFSAAAAEGFPASSCFAESL